MKISSVGIALFHADRRKDRRTDIRKLKVAFRNFANAPNSCTLNSDCIYVYCIYLRRNSKFRTILPKLSGFYK